MASIWTQTAELPQFQTLQENIHVDVLIIGGGMSGIYVHICWRRKESIMHWWKRIE